MLSSIKKLTLQFTFTLKLKMKFFRLIDYADLRYEGIRWRQLIFFLKRVKVRVRVWVRLRVRVRVRVLVRVRVRVRVTGKG